jgi:hypothetical protein
MPLRFPSKALAARLDASLRWHDMDRIHLV